jgi:preprotein translocase SecE subunit
MVRAADSKSVGCGFESLLACQFYKDRMENQYQKVVNITYLVLAALIAFVSLLAMMKVASTYDLESRVKSIEFIIRGLSVLVGAGIFFGLYSNSKANGFMNEVASELLTKVTWPAGKETMTATVVVIITVILAGIVLAIFDWFFTVSLQWLWSGAQRWFM